MIEYRIFSKYGRCSTTSVRVVCKKQPGQKALLYETASVSHDGKLCETLPKHKGYKVFFDNYFAFLELFWRDGICSVATILSNRLRGCPVMPSNQLKRRGRGATDFCRTKDNKLCVLNNFGIKIQVPESGKAIETDVGIKGNVYLLTLLFSPQKKRRTTQL
ncbi:hypothetical protein T4D_6288 [Trichinella pseudospiralis]|uniref:PiggyBac transposable element-derived protein domain-containing protein n=1 Tax=Trichinella pseudospiralis TaxID=6337 RepID=A0A0V1FJQ9_TRIPS|nr:hypothetical protein T4D_6288 [Trichinella pseudospiralis]